MTVRTKLTGAQLKAEADTRAGCVRLSYCRHGTGPLVGVYRSLEAGMETDHETPWSVVCEEHDDPRLHRDARGRHVDGDRFVQLVRRLPRSRKVTPTP